MFYTVTKNQGFRWYVLVAMAVLLGTLAGIGTSLAAFSPLAIGLDTIAGQTTNVKAKNFLPNELVNFSVSKPDGVTVSLSTKSNANGEAVVDLYDYHTKTAGIYSVIAFSADKSEKTVKTTFKVFPASLDVVSSKVEVDRTVLKADGADMADVKVKVYDAFGNALDGHSIKLISSRKEDSINPSVAISNADGLAEFKVASAVSGLSNLMALDMAEDEILDQRLALSFADGGANLTDAGGDLVKIANAASVGPLSAFDITGLPPTVKANENINFSVKAVDATDNTVQDYTGTVRFSAEGDNSSGVTLPANYKFLASDLGVHAFDLGLSFAQAGTYKILVNDLTDKFKQGQVTVVVGDVSGGVNGGATGGGVKPILSSPVAGTYSQAQQTVSGTAKSSSTIKIYDNDQEIGSVPAGPTGKFTYQTPNLTDGKHTIYVSNIDTISLAVVGTSDSVDVNIDTTAPALDDLQIDPSTGIKAGSVINVKVFSEKNLSEASVTFNFDIIPLTVSVDDPTAYVGTIQAPADAGVYKMNVLLVDQLRNEKTYEAAATVTVDPKGGDITKSPDLTKTPTTPVTPAVTPVTPPVATDATAPSQVSGLIAYGSDKRITLVWNAATDDKQVVKYKIYYGQDVTQLTQVVMTKDAGTTWYVSGLENGKEYFFAVSAIDNEGNESVMKSEIVSGIPFVLEIKNALSQAPTQSIAQSDLYPAAYSGPYPTKTPGTGPELFVIVGATGVLSAFWISRRKKK